MVFSLLACQYDFPNDMGNFCNSAQSDGSGHFETPMFGLNFREFTKGGPSMRC